VGRHLFDARERATHEVVAQQLRGLADEVATGTIDLADEEWAPPMVVLDPVDVTVDLLQRRNEVQLTVRLSWPVAKGDGG